MLSRLSPLISALLLITIILLLSPLGLKAMVEREEEKYLEDAKSRDATENNAEKARLERAKRAFGKYDIGSSSVEDRTSEDDFITPLQSQQKSASGAHEESDFFLCLREKNLEEGLSSTRSDRMERARPSSILTSYQKAGAFLPETKKQPPSSRGITKEEGPGQHERADLRKEIKKKVFFPDLAPLSPHVQEEDEDRETISSQPPSKVLLADGAGEKSFKRKVRRLKTEVTGLEIALSELAETRSGDGEQKATLFQQADLTIRSHFQELLETALEKDSRPARVADVYATATPEVKEYLYSVLLSMDDDSAKKGEQTAEHEVSLLPAVRLLELHFFLAEVKAEADQITEEDPERSSKVAELYEEAYPEVQAQFESFRVALERHEIESDTSAALALASMGIAVLETAFNTLDREKIKPIKVQDKVNDFVLTARKIPWENAPFQEVKSSDIDATIPIHGAENAVKNLKELMRILKLPDAEMGAALHNEYIQMAWKTLKLVTKKSLSISARERALNGIETEEAETARANIEEELRAAFEEENRREIILATLKVTPLIADALQARERAINDIEDMARIVLQAGDELRKFYAQKN